MVSGGGALIEDLGSKNGTFVGDRRVGAPLALQNGDQIRVGDHTLEFRESSVIPTLTQP